MAEETSTPVEQVVTLLKEMKAEVEATGKEDDAAYEEYACWCKTNKEEHEAQVEQQKQEIADLNNAIESGVAKEAQLGAEIKTLKEDIAEDEQALEQATAIREKESAEYQAEAADMNETIMLLGQAIEVLSKVQLLQKTGHSLHSASVKPLVLALDQKLRGVDGKLNKFKHVMQKDLWDFLGSISDVTGSTAQLRSNAALAQQKQSPSGLTGQAAGASSYNAASSSIYGMLEQMKDDFEKDLTDATKAEEDAQARYDELKKAKTEEIAAATAQQNMKENELSVTVAAVAKAKEDLAATEEALSKDEKFLIDLEEACTKSETEYNERTATRGEELQALSEAIKILMEDDSRDLFAKTMSFLQTGERHAKGALSTDAQNKAINKAMRHVLHTARKHQNWALASLAVHLRLDSFTKVKEAMDKMLAELKVQQQDESDKRDMCNFEIDATEDMVTEKTHEKEDLEATKLGLENDIATLNKEIDTLEASVAAVKVSLKEGSEDRKKENQAYQESVSEQRATINILEKALERLKMFYIPNAKLMQIQAHTGKDDPPPVKTYSVEYKKSGGATPVIEMINKIITDASKMEKELTTSEQNSQDSYAMFVNDCMATITADNKAINEKNIFLQQATASASDTDKALLQNQEELDALGQLLTGMHADCDWLLKYYSVRQQARAEEMQAIVEAKAILSGADFGSEETDAA